MHSCRQWKDILKFIACWNDPWYEYSFTQFFFYCVYFTRFCVMFVFCRHNGLTLTALPLCLHAIVLHICIQHSHSHCTVMMSDWNNVNHLSFQQTTVGTSGSAVKVRSRHSFYAYGSRDAFPRLGNDTFYYCHLIA